MLRSVFAKYVMTFMALLSVSFLLLLFIVHSVVSNHTHRAEQQDMAGVAEACAEHLSEMYGQSGQADFGDFIRDHTVGDAYVLRLISAAMTNFEDMTVYVTDASGGFIFCTGKASASAPAVGTPLFSPEDGGETRVAEVPAAMNLPSLSGDTETETALSGVFFDPAIPLDEQSTGQAYRLAITDDSGVCVGYVVVTSTAEIRDTTMNAALRSMFAAALWVMSPP